MRTVWTIFKREMRSYFVSPVAYIIGGLFLILAGLFFVLPFFFSSNEATLRNWAGTVVVFLLFLAPMFTMRLVAEEKQSGTIELLLTSPVRDWEVIAGKFLAAMGLWLSILAATLVYPIILKVFGNPDIIPMATAYLALILMGGAMLAVGVLSSAVSPNQIVAVVLTFALVLLLYVAQFLENVFGTGTLVGSIFNYLSLQSHMSDLMKGVLDSKDIVYYLSIIVGCLFISTRFIEARRWG